MSGVRREWDYLVLTSREDMSVIDEEKAEVMAKAFVQVHGCKFVNGGAGRERET